MLEKQIQQKVLNYCKSHGIVALKVDSTSSRGIPDLTVITPAGHVLFVELKTQTGRLSPLQTRMHTKLRENNANVYTIRSPAEFEALIEKFTHS